MQAKLMEMKVLAQLIGTIGTQRVAFDTAVQTALVECVGHSVAHGNITPAMQMLDAIGAHLKPAVVAYLEMFGNMKWDKAQKKLVFQRFLEPTGWTDAFREKCEAFVWVKAKKEGEPKSIFDVAEETDKFLDRLLKAGKKGVEIKHKPLLDRLVDTLNRYNAETYLAKTTVLPTAEDVQAVADAGASPEKLQELQQQFGGRPTPVKKPKAGVK